MSQSNHAVELVGPQLGRGAAVGRHRAVCPRPRTRRRRPRGLGRPDDLGAVPRELAGRELAGRIRAALAHQSRVSAERLRPCGDVRSLAAGTGMGDRNAVVSDHERALELDDHIEEQVAESGQPHRKIVAWTTTVGQVGFARSRSAASSVRPERSRHAAGWRRPAARCDPAGPGRVRGRAVLSRARRGGGSAPPREG